MEGENRMDVGIEENASTREEVIRRIEGTLLTYKSAHRFVWTHQNRIFDSKENLEEAEKWYDETISLENFRKLVIGRYQNEENLEKLGKLYEDALDVFFILVSRQIIIGDYNKNFLENYFANYFDNFYAQGVNTALMAGIMLLTGKTTSVEDIEKFWAPTEEYDPATRENFAETFRQADPAKAVDAFQGLLKTVDEFKARGKAALVPLLAILSAESSPMDDIELNKLTPEMIKEGRELGFQMLSEFETLGEFAEIGAKLFAKFNRGMWVPLLYEDKLTGIKVNRVARVLRQWSEDEMLRGKLPKIFEWLLQREIGPDTAGCIFYGILEIEKHFPGGIDAFLDFMDEVYEYYTGGDEVSIYLTRFLGDAPENKADFFRIGKMILKYLRESSGPYFSYGEWHPELRKLFETDVKAFEKEINKLKEFVFNHSLNAHRFQAHGTSIFAACLFNWGDPNFQGYLEGFGLLLKRIGDPLREVKFGDDRKTIMEVVDYIDHSIEDGKKDDRNSLKEMDYKGYAILRSLLAADMEQKKIPKEVKALRRQVIRKVFGKRSNNSEHLDTLLATENLIMDLREGESSEGKTAELQEKLKLLKKTSIVQNVMERVAREAAEALRLAEWKDIVGVGARGPNILEAETDLAKDSWIFEANPSTQMAATSGALFLAFGLDGISDDLPELRGIIPDGVLEPMPEEEFRPLREGKIGIADFVRSIKKNGLVAKLKKNIRIALPYVADAIRKKRLQMPGLMVVGSKVEAPESMNRDDVEFALNLAGLGDVRTTPFKLKHNGNSLVNPPLPSALEEKLLIYFFTIFGAVDPKISDLQITIGARLDNKNAGVLGASSILASAAYVKYKPGAFSSMNDIETACKIMVYDAGVRVNSLPFDVKGANGRTDKVGSRSLFDIDYVQLLGTHAAHRQCGGFLSDQAAVYADNFLKLLDEHGLLSAMNESFWIRQKNAEWDCGEYHEEMIGTFTAARGSNETLKEGVRHLMLKDLIKPLRARREEIIREHPADYEKLLNY